ncbi:MAG: LuxR C-terminal-related transcriptional regulator [Flavobacteriales bacterium]
MSAPIKLLLADHGQLALLGLRALFAEQAGVELVGEARDPIALQAMVVRYRPHVALIDHTSEGFSADDIRNCLRRLPRLRVAAISHQPSALVVQSAVRAGAIAYVKKDCDLQEVRDAVFSAAMGERYFCGKVVEGLRRSGIDLGRFAADPLSCAAVTLTPRECEVISLIAEGHSYTRIAERLHLSAHTVTTHRKNIMQKLGVNSTAGVVMYAVRNGLASPNHFLFNAGR